MPRVLITGAGVVSPIGNDLQDFWQGIHTGRQGINNIKSFDTSHYPSTLGAEVKNFTPTPLDPKIDKKELFIRSAVAEVFQKYPFIAAVPPQQRYLHLGAGLDYFDLPDYVASAEAVTGDWHRFSFETVSIVRQLAQEYGFAGGYSVNVNACVASSQAIGLSFRQLRENEEAQLILSGGFDSMLNALHYMGFYKLGALANWQGAPEEACRPFDKKRCGLVLGEGAAVLLLQNTSPDSPTAVLGEIVGYAASMDSYMVSDPHPEGIHLARAAVDAIAEAGLAPDDIDCVHLHGTGTLKNCLAESAAMARIFPNRFSEIPVFSLKGQVGHLIGACGALEMLAVLYSLQHQVVPPTVNFKEPDPAVPLNVIKNEPLSMPIRHILKLNAAFGGQNTALVIKKHVP